MFPLHVRHLATAPIVVLLAGWSPHAAAQKTDSAATLSIDQIVDRLQQANHRRTADLKRYSATRNYRLEYHGLGSVSAEMVVEAQYDAPATKRFRVVSEQGSKLIRNKVFKRLLEAEQEAADPATQRKTALSSENYEFRLLGEEALDGRQCYVVDVAPRTSNKFLYRGKVWIDAQDFAVVQIDARPAVNPSFWIRHTAIHHKYTKLGEFWLPLQNRTISNMKLGGAATLTIDYGQYAISPATP
jgi:negative regulator of sigma E activity